MQPQKQTFLNRLKDILTLSSTQTYVNKEPTIQEKTNQYISSLPPDLQKMLNAMALRESINGKVRVNPGDQNVAAIGSKDLNSYGLLHMGQAAVDVFNNRPKGDLEFVGRDLKAKNLYGPESDPTQKLIQGYRINKYMQKYGKDLFTATKNIQNYREPNYATSTMSNYDKYLQNVGTSTSQ